MLQPVDFRSGRSMSESQVRNDENRKIKRPCPKCSAKHKIAEGAGSRVTAQQNARNQKSRKYKKDINTDPSQSGKVGQRARELQVDHVIHQHKKNGNRAQPIQLRIEAPRLLALARTRGSRIWASHRGNEHLFSF